MQRMILEHAFAWDAIRNAFVPVELSDRISTPGLDAPLRFASASVPEERLSSVYIERLAELMQIDPELPVLLVPRFRQWDPEIQDWEFGRVQTAGLCTNVRAPPCVEREFSCAYRVVVSLGARDPFCVLAHEMMHAVMTTLPQVEEGLMRRWGDLVTELHQAGERFDWRDRYEGYEFLLDFEEAEAEAFALWATHRRLPYGLHRREVRMALSERHGLDLRRLEQMIVEVEQLYGAILAGRRSARRNILGANAPRAGSNSWIADWMQRMLGLIPTAGLRHPDSIASWTVDRWKGGLFH